MIRKTSMRDAKTAAPGYWLQEARRSRPGGLSTEGPTDLFLICLRHIATKAPNRSHLRNGKATYRATRQVRVVGKLFRAFGRRAPETGWPEGAYRGYVVLQRDGRVLAARHADIGVISR